MLIGPRLLEAKEPKGVSLSGVLESFCAGLSLGRFTNLWSGCLTARPGFFPVFLTVC
jgi:hypothetical protein